ncbi:hypothetical protein [Streptomyces laculatispora]|uniref:hypothetical protein n=1 Tax=Streptomyces laculatispora TaxID=887464 RepID=UPI001A9411AB|nr:hypothetical protein [Streptomyces laculatispora]MBO0915478.1 hypothetical protein [Streptomyces laculatispora]
MNGVLSELGRRLAERLVALLVLPGLLYLGAALSAAALGGARLDEAGRAVRRAVAPITGAVATPSASSWLSVALLLTAVLVAAGASGLAAQAAGAVVDRVWAGPWPDWAERLARPLTDRRARAWDAADRLRDGTTGAELDARTARRNRIGLRRPSAPTWMADRLRAADSRIWQEYGLDLTVSWPRLWLVLPDSSRTAVQAARERLTATTLLAGWGVLYALLGLLWWPAVAVGAVIGVTAWRRTRAAFDTLAELVEAVVDVHGPELAAALGVPVSDQRLTPPIGRVLVERFRKSS